MEKRILILLLSIFPIGLTAQMRIQDSLALVDLYNATDGANWIHNDNWLTGPVYTWIGVGTNGSHSYVGGLDLSNNNLSGVIPASIGNLKDCGTLTLEHNLLRSPIPKSIGSMTWLRSLDLRYNNFTDSVPDSLVHLPNFYEIYIDHNQFTYIPDFTQLPLYNTFFKTDIQNNKLTFEYIEPIINCDLIHYSPQDSVLEALNLTHYSGTNITLHCKVGGTANQYQWTKDSVDILGANDTVYVINNFSATDTGIYSCKITNTICTALTLHRRHIRLHLKDTTVAINNMNPPVFGFLYNPSREQLQISLPYESICEISIYNADGKLLQNQFKRGNEINIDVSGLKQGVYLVSIKANGIENKYKFAKY